MEAGGTARAEAHVATPTTTFTDGHQLGQLARRGGDGRGTTSDANTIPFGGGDTNAPGRPTAQSRAFT
jgi:hypothetical protein